MYESLRDYIVELEQSIELDKQYIKLVNKETGKEFLKSSRASLARCKRTLKNARKVDEQEGHRED